MIKRLTVILGAATSMVLMAGCNQPVYGHTTHHTTVVHHYHTFHHYVYHTPRVKTYRSGRR